jgi:hypothetical protein
LPFAGYKDFAACVAANSDKKDPKAYCATIMRAVEKAETEDQAPGSFRIAKLDPDQNLVFGWASVAVQKDGTTLVDKQGDVIDPQELETAAYDFVLDFREADEMHDQVTKGALVESLVVTPAKLESMGLAPDALPMGWWVGFKVEPATFAKVRAGQLSMFSIEGKAQREEI